MTPVEGQSFGSRFLYNRENPGTMPLLPFVEKPRTEALTLNGGMNE